MDQSIKPWVEYSTGETWTRPSDGKTFPIMRKLIIFNNFSLFDFSTSKTFHKIKGIAGSYLRVDHLFSTQIGGSFSDGGVTSPADVVISLGIVSVSFVGSATADGDKLSLMFSYAVDPDSPERQNNLPDIFEGINPKNISMYSNGLSENGPITLIIKNSRGQSLSSIIIAGFNLNDFLGDTPAFVGRTVLSGVAEDDLIENDEFDRGAAAASNHIVIAVKNANGKTYDTKLFFMLFGQLNNNTVDNPDDNLMLHEYKVALNDKPLFMAALVGYGTLPNYKRMSIGMLTGPSRVAIMFTNSNGICQKYVTIIQVNATDIVADTTVGAVRNRGQAIWMDSNYTETLAVTASGTKDTVIVVIVDNPAAATTAGSMFFVIPKADFAAANKDIKGYLDVNFATAKPNLKTYAFQAY